MPKYYVSMTDKFMSGWGAAKNVTNKLVIICDSIEQAETVERNALKRSEMRYVNLCLNKPRYPESRYLTTWKSFSDLGTIWTQ